MTGDYSPATRAEVVAARTGKTWDAWFRILDAWDAVAKGHKATAAYLQEAHGVPGWWAQNVTVEYERARGLRRVGQKSDGGFAAGVQRTVDADAAAALAWWTDGRKRRAWLTDEVLAAALQGAARSARTSETAMGLVLRFDLVGPEATRERLTVTVQPKGARSVVRVDHEGMADKARRDEVKARWAPALDALKARLQGA